MVNIVFCISEGNRKKVEDEFSFRAVTLSYGYEESKLMLDHFLSKFGITSENQIDAKLQLKYFDETENIDLRRISHIRIKKRVVQVFVAGRKNSLYQAYAKLSDLERGLKELGFVRVSRFHMVSLNHIQKIAGSEIVLSAGKSVKIGRGYRQNVKDLLQDKTIIGTRK